MSESPASSRHLAIEGLREFVSQRASTGFLLEGEPLAYIDIDVPADSLTLRLRGQTQGLVDLSEYRHISADNVFLGGEYWTAIRVSGSGNILEAYPIFCAIADRVQIDGCEINSAVSEVLGNYSDLLAGKRRMSDDQEVGLVGELFALQALIRTLGPETALNTWRGPLDEEHDFGLHHFDLEVKTTLSERRCHWIGSLEQLRPSHMRPLFLLSIQLTTIGDPSVGVSLPELVARTNKLLVDSQARFDQYLQAQRWTDELSSLFTRRFLLRSRPWVFAINHEFPAITDELLSRAGASLVHVMQVKYQLDLTGYPAASTLPMELEELTWEKQK